MHTYGDRRNAFNVRHGMWPSPRPQYRPSVGDTYRLSSGTWVSLAGASGLGGHHAGSDQFDESDSRGTPAHRRRSRGHRRSGSSGWSGGGTTPNFGPPTEVNGSGGGAGHFASVSCTDPSDCTAVGHDNNDQPIYATETSGTWGTATEVTGSGGGSGYFFGVSCTDASDCTAVGYDDNDQPIYATETGGTWGTPTEVTGSGGGYGYFYGVSCTDATDCTAVGHDTTASPSTPPRPAAPGARPPRSPAPVVAVAASTA